MAPRMPPSLARRPPPRHPFLGRGCSLGLPGFPAGAVHSAVTDVAGAGHPLPGPHMCAQPGPMWPPSSPPSSPPGPPTAAAKAGLPGRRAEARAWLLEEPRICSKCKQQVILSLPPPRVALTHLTLEGTGLGGGGQACGYF